jgi:hypothetical protein
MDPIVQNVEIAEAVLDQYVASLAAVKDLSYFAYYAGVL